MPTELSRAQIESFTAALDARGAEQADAEPAPAAPIQALPVPSITRTAAVLSRFAAVFPGERLPQDITSIPWAAQLQLKDADGELHALLTGQASAELELAVLNGSWSHTARFRPPAKRPPLSWWPPPPRTARPTHGRQRPGTSAPSWR